MQSQTPLSSLPASECGAQCGGLSQPEPAGLQVFKVPPPFAPMVPAAQTFTAGPMPSPWGSTSLMHLARAPWHPQGPVDAQAASQFQTPRPRVFARESVEVPLASGAFAALPMWRAFEPPVLSATLLGNRSSPPPKPSSLARATST